MIWLLLILYIVIGALVVWKFNILAGIAFAFQYEPYWVFVLVTLISVALWPLGPIPVLVIASIMEYFER